VAADTAVAFVFGVARSVASVSRTRSVRPVITPFAAVVRTPLFPLENLEYDG